MKWPVVVQAIVAAGRGNSDLMSELEGEEERFVRNGVFRPKKVPSVEWLRVTNPQEENTERVHIQFDIWTNTTAQAAAIELLLRNTYLGIGAHDVGGLTVLTPEEEIDSRDLPDPEPELVHNVLDIVFVPARTPMH